MAAATIFIAFVICCVDITDPILFFTSFKLGMLLRALYGGSGIPSRQVQRYFLDCFQIRVFQSSGAEVIEDTIVLRAHDLQEIPFEVPDLVDRH